MSVARKNNQNLRGIVPDVTRARSSVRKIIPRLRRYRVAHRVADLAFSYVGAFDGRGEWNMTTGGELELLRRLGPCGLRTIFDVGANEGDWTNTASTFHPDATIHAFEPIPATATELRRNVVGLARRVIVNECALGAVAERRRVSLNVPHPTMVSLLSSEFDEAHPGVEIEVVRGDTYCETNEIERIDMVKIDTEGFDHLVLEGLGRFVDDGRIDVVQFEYGPWALQTKYLLHDYYKFFDARGYVIGRVHPSGVEFVPYSLRHEDFQGLNWVAVRAARRDLASRLRER